MMLDQARIDETRSLLGEETFAMFLQRLEVEFDEFVAWLDATPTPAADEIALRCHTLASSAGIYGASELRRTLLATEQVAQSDTATKMTELADATRSITDVWAETLRAFRSIK
ncbi:hypothetical protein E2K80_11270 [Rhodophyticola sp. CCM32]|uniref:Hpt domain-containing protein n=1 Tax=Rhodophyticola sp. CCM32 TaxID=2916397 RepID=UPI00107F293E|nr:Hpt domain-containing protein [Rhodophyticola sp. CCM32]QBY01233.1 hypothetical protein E2K80_11270 [Rhodophyticola sp. CCM32]